MKTGQIKEIIDGVYFQKLSLLLGNLQNWEKKKQQVFFEMYVTNIQKHLILLENDEKQIKHELLEFIKVLNLQYQLVSKLKREEKAVDISSSLPCLQNFVAQFTAIKDSLLQLSDFLGKFMGVTNYEYTEIRKLYDQAGQVKLRYEHQKSRFLHSYNQKKQLIYSKKNMKKHFELVNILDLLSQVQKQRKIHEQAFMRLHGIFNRQLEQKQKMFKNIIDNLIFISKLYEAGFKKEILEEVIEHFKKKYQENNKQLSQFKQTQQFPNCENCMKQIREQFYKYFNSFIQEITVGNWNVIFHKKNQSNQKIANQKQTTQMFLTFDKKIFFYKLLQRYIEFEQTIDDVKIYEPSEDGKFQIKNKKTKQKYIVSFDRVQKEDQFFLHINQMIKQK